MMAWFDNGFHFAATWLAIGLVVALIFGRCAHFGMGDDGQEQGQ
jgi:hypothetical protein